MTWNKFAVIVAPAIALALGAPGGARAGQNLVLNGGFELTTNGPGQIGWDTSVTDWSTTSYSFIYGAGTADTTGVYSPQFGGSIYLWGPGAGGGSSNNGLTASSPNGGNFLSADGSYNNTTISQTIGGLTAGDTYKVGFWWAGAQQYAYTGVTNDYWTVGFGSETQTTPTVSNTSGGFTGWMYQTMTFTASSTSDVLSFFATGAPGIPPFLLLDGVTLNAVPEPSTVSLMVVGVLALAPSACAGIQGSLLRSDRLSCVDRAKLAGRDTTFPLGPD